MRILLAAEEAAGAQALALLRSGGHHVCGVLTADDRRTGPSFVAAATELGAAVLAPERVKDPAFAGWVRQESVDLLLNVHSLHLVTAAVLAAPAIGSFNLHPGPLPGYAGLNVPSWAIYEGETAHAVTLHWMRPAVDAGPVAFAASFGIGPADTGVSVMAKCVKYGIPLIAELLERAPGGRAAIPAVEQDQAGRRYFGRAVPHEGWVPWFLPVRRVVDFVRACDYRPWPSPWGEPRCKTGDVELTLARAKLTGEPSLVAPGVVGRLVDGDALVATADEWVRVGRFRHSGQRVAAAEVLCPGQRLGPGPP